MKQQTVIGEAFRGARAPADPSTPLTSDDQWRQSKVQMITKQEQSINQQSVLNRRKKQQ